MTSRSDPASEHPEPTVSALVVLRPAEGELRGDDLITVDNLEQFLPAHGAMDTATTWFRSAGFGVEAPGPTSFSIDADAELFRSWFGTSSPPFDSTMLPRPVRDLLAAVEVPGPPDFGPGNP